MAAALLLATSSLARGDGEIQIHFNKCPFEAVFEFYSELSINTALVRPAQVTRTQTLTLSTAKGMDRASARRLVEDELDKQVGLKIRHVTLAEAMGLNLVEQGMPRPVLDISLPPLPDRSLAAASNEIASISLHHAPLSAVKEFYEKLSGTRVIYRGNLSDMNEATTLMLKVSLPMTKETALKLLDLTLAAQCQIKVLREAAGATVWLRDTTVIAPPKVKTKRNEKP